MKVVMKAAQLVAKQVASSVQKMDSNWVDMKAWTKVDMMEQHMERWKASLRAALKDCLKVERTGALMVDKSEMWLK
jgi:hypothetical protein